MTGGGGAVHMKSGDLMRSHSWPVCIAYVFSIALSITIDILNYSCPLPFLPSVLEDRGHKTMEIVAAVGVYYWAGFAGGAIVTSWQIYKVLYSPAESVLSVKIVKRNIFILTGCLTIGALSLVCQAMKPTLTVHTYARLVQGFFGAFIFFYCFLLAQQLFKGQQQIFALTVTSAALNIAEVSGSFFGAAIYSSHGQRAVFWFLAAATGVNMLMLFATAFHIRPAPPDYVSEPGSPRSQAASPLVPQAESAQANGNGGNWAQVHKIFSNPLLHRAVLAIAAAAVVKGAVEEILPFFADHQFHFDPFELGLCFTLIAVAYIFSAAATGFFWDSMRRGTRIGFTAFWLCCLGGAALGILLTYKFTSPVFQPLVGVDAKVLLRGALLVYGICLGFTHTPASLLLADATDAFSDNNSKDAVNGIWNTMWEAGGSLGFLLGGFFSHSYNKQLQIGCALAVWSLFSGVYLLLVDRRCQTYEALQKARREGLKSGEKGYGSLACKDV